MEDFLHPPPFSLQVAVFGLINNALHASEADMSHADATGFGCCQVAQKARFLVTFSDIIGDGV